MSIQQGIIFALVLFPALAALVLLFIKNNKVRKPIVIGSAAIIAALSIVLAVMFLGQGTVTFKYNNEIVSLVFLAVDVIIGIYIFNKGVKDHNVLAVVLAIIQTLLVIFMEFGPLYGLEAQTAIVIDSLSIIMALIIGIIGTAIAIYALGYMEDFAHHHDDVKDRRPMFFALMFVFLAAMYGIVLSNNMTWMLCAWEVTTVCSFILIGYTRTPEAIRNSFRQINMNLLGGIAFSCGILASYYLAGTIELDVLVTSAIGNGFAAVSLPIALLAFAGITKAAQMPFQTWLLGAMVAPTPVSALLHSSTMVKAGVFLLIKLAPALGSASAAGLMVMSVGGLTFVFTAVLAMTQSNAKRVLAYSTISNLGLITACAGIGTPEAVWAAIFLLIFHALAKSLLFMAVGSTEHRIGSRDIEDMDALLARMPRMTKLMALGICAMFIAPFGMLVSKWAGLVAFTDSGNLMLMLSMAFGSAATFFFWTKWLGKLVALPHVPTESVEKDVKGSEWFAIILAAVLTVVFWIGVPLMSEYLILPYLTGMFGYTSGGLDSMSLWYMVALCIIVCALVLIFPHKKDRKMQPIYLSGVNKGGITFENSLSGMTEATQRNWYFADYIDEVKTSRVAEVVCIALLVFAIALLLFFVLFGGAL